MRILQHFPLRKKEYFQIPNGYSEAVNRGKYNTVNIVMVNKTVQNLSFIKQTKKNKNKKIYIYLREWMWSSGLGRWT